MVIRMEVVSDKAIDDINAVISTGLKKVEKALFEWGVEFRALYKKTVASWKKKPTFDITVSVGPNEMWVAVGTNNDIYRFLHDGTSIRWAFLSEDFRPKTTPRLLGSGPGAGAVLFRGRGTMQKLGLPAGPGIEAREWTQEIIAQEEKEFLRTMEEVFFSIVPKDQRI